MNDFETLRKTVKCGILAGHSRATIFCNILRQNGVSVGDFPVDEIEQWFDCVEKCKPEHTWFLNQFHSLIQLIHIESEKARRGCNARRCSPECKLQILSERYAVDARHVNFMFRSLVLFDMQHGEKRELTTEGVFPKTLHAYDYTLTVLDAEHIFIVDGTEKFEASERCFIYLFKLDYTNLKATILDVFVTRGHYYKLTHNLSDPERFFFSVWWRDEQLHLPPDERPVEPPEDHMHFGRIENGKLKFDKKLIAVEQRVIDYSALKFCGNKLYEVCFENLEDDSPDTVRFREFDVLPNKLKKVKQCENVKNGNFEWKCMENHHAVWSRSAINCEDTVTKCYILCEPSQPGPAQLFLADLEKETFTKVKELDCSDLSDVFLGGNGVLIVATKNPSTDQHIFYRFALNEPDNLLNLSLTQINQQSLFLNDHEYNQLGQKMPPVLLPFGRKLDNDFLFDGLASEFSQMEI